MALKNNHRYGINPVTYSGERALAKDPDFSKVSGILLSTYSSHKLTLAHAQSYMQDADLYVSSTSDLTAIYGPNVRSRPQPLIDGTDGAGVPLRHAMNRTSSDFLLTALHQRMLAGTITVVTGTESRSMLENVALAIESEREARVYKRKVSVGQLFGVKNEAGEYLGGESSFDLVSLASTFLQTSRLLKLTHSPMLLTLHRLSSTRKLKRESRSSRSLSAVLNGVPELPPHPCETVQSCSAPLKRL